MSEEIEKSPELHPRDILEPIATLIGLLVAAVGFLSTAKLPPGAFQALIVLISIIIFVFVITAVLTALFFAMGRIRFWNYSLKLYPISWVIFGAGVLFILIEVAFGIPSIKIPNLPVTNLSSVLIFTLIALGVVSTIAVAFFSVRHARKEVKELKMQFEDARKKVESLENAQGVQILQNFIYQPGTNYQMNFMNAAIQLEVLSRSIAMRNGVEPADVLPVSTINLALLEKNIIGIDIYNALELVRNTKSRIIHGVDISDSLAQEALATARGLRKVLLDIQEPKKGPP